MRGRWSCAHFVSRSRGDHVCEARGRRAGRRAGGRAPRAAAEASRLLARRRRAASRVAPPARGGVLRWLQPGLLERHARRACEQPPVGGHRGGGQARDGVDLVLLVSLVDWVCSSSAQKEAKNSTAVLSVSSLDAHRPRAPRKAGWWSRGARRRRSNWFGTSAGSISTRPAPSGSPASALGGRRTAGRDPQLRTKITRRQGGGGASVP